jgi:hypothetical protein
LKKKIQYQKYFNFCEMILSSTKIISKKILTFFPKRWPKTFYISSSTENFYLHRNKSIEFHSKSGRDLAERRMLSSRVVEASGDCQCQNRSSPGFDPSILRVSDTAESEGRAADEAVLNKVHKKIPKNPPFKNLIITWLVELNSLPEIPLVG